MQRIFEYSMIGIEPDLQKRMVTVAMQEIKVFILHNNLFKSNHYNLFNFLTNLVCSTTITAKAESPTTIKSTTYSLVAIIEIATTMCLAQLYNFPSMKMCLTTSYISLLMLEGQPNLLSMGKL